MGCCEMRPIENKLEIRQFETNLEHVEDGTAENESEKKKPEKPDFYDNPFNSPSHMSILTEQES
jgi:hypothetical protein